MRLGQLARQLEIKPDKIVAFLEKEKGITIKTHPNSKVEDDLIELISAQFKSAVKEVEIKEEPKAKKENPTVKETEVIAEEAPKPVEHIETVKAAAPQELKIIGKIDLPNRKEVKIEVDGVVYDQETLDIKKREDKKIESEKKAIANEAKKKEADEKRRLAKEKREVEAERQAMLKTEKHNLLTKEEEKKKAILLLTQKKREEKLEAKRKKSQKDHYKQQVSATTSTTVKKKKKVVENKAEQATESVTETEIIQPIVEEVREKSVYKRFIKWLNT
jgi:hypothetical protein